MKIWHQLMSVSICAAMASAGDIWMEDFASDVGRFQTTSGQASSVFTYDSTAESLEGIFVRRDESDALDRRLAMLSRIYTEDDAVEFFVDWFCVSENGNAWPLVGFYDSVTLEDVAVVRIGVDPGAENHYELSINWNHPPDLLNIDPTGTFWRVGRFYRLKFLIDGPAREIGLTTFELVGSDFVVQGSGVWTIPQDLTWEFDSIGIGNLRDDHGQGTTVVARFDNFRMRAIEKFPKGDLNCDNEITVSDIGPFVQALTAPIQYIEDNENCDLLNADINSDDSVTVADIGLFVSILVGQ